MNKINFRRFLPPPLVLVNTARDVKIAEPGKLKKGCHFAEFPVILPLNVSFPK